MRTKILYRKSLSKEDRSYISFEQNHWCYLIPTLRFNTEWKSWKIREISLIWLFWELSLFFDYMPKCLENTSDTAMQSKLNELSEVSKKTS